MSAAELQRDSVPSDWPRPLRFRTQEGNTTSLPCFSNISRERPAIVSVAWYLDKMAPGKEVRNETLIVCLCRVETLGLGFGTRNGTLLVGSEALGGGPLWISQLEASTILLWAAFYAFSFFSVATDSTIY
ncbi:PREDICTED: natural cytotoxicity triggering receptor 3-like [Chrysochloris asiatica]|uniref:Natural cytotoxicity triggering receptor 3-like n=1 Tax=Chrysochloris asiatica TaxID=185453 RepID=A0A9B0X237_CHRAS|nr:PREDICTED: natural cytotoxicity triggering receptor 3-like [Chrysochloris asiatica]